MEFGPNIANDESGSGAPKRVLSVRKQSRLLFINGQIEYLDRRAKAPKVAGQDSDHTITKGVLLHPAIHYHPDQTNTGKMHDRNASSAAATRGSTPPLAIPLMGLLLKTKLMVRGKLGASRGITSQKRCGGHTAAMCAKRSSLRGQREGAAKK